MFPQLVSLMAEFYSASPYTLNLKTEVALYTKATKLTKQGCSVEKLIPGDSPNG